MTNSELEDILAGRGGSLRAVGLSPDMEVFLGYDEQIWPTVWPDGFTRADMVTIADHMVARWTKFRELVGRDPVRP